MLSSIEPVNSNTRITSLSDRSLLVSFGDVIDPDINKNVLSLHKILMNSAFDGFIESVPAYSSLAVFYDIKKVREQRETTAFDFVKNYISRLLQKSNFFSEKESSIQRIPVCYDPEFGFDIFHIASNYRLSIDEVIDLHASVTYRVYMVGFMPGFAYMGTVEERINTPRRDQPRVLVPAGSVGIAGAQTGIYPIDSPGGWQIIGKTPLRLFDINNLQPCVFSAGDRVQFFPIKKMNLTPLPVKIIKPGIFSTIQDLGRTGYRQAGIGPGGAMDFFAASAANILTGNDANSPVIEMHFPAVELLFEQDVLITITGANFSCYIDNVPLALWTPVSIKKNQRLYFKKYIDGARVYLSIYGGIKADNWLNSYSTHSKLKAGGHKGRALLKDDIIELNSKAPQIPADNFPGITDVIAGVYSPPGIIRYIKGPEWERLNEESKSIFMASSFIVTAQSDRMGYRLKGINLSLLNPAQLVSSPVDSGTIQLLPNGQLILLMADHQTTGGYPRIATVIGADLPKLAQAPIHNTLKFELVDIAEAGGILIFIVSNTGKNKRYQ